MTFGEQKTMSDLNKVAALTARSDIKLHMHLGSIKMGGNKMRIPMLILNKVVYTF